MLKITIPATEMWDGTRFIYTEERTLQLEHSLVSLQKWESKWCKPFLSKEGLTSEETIDYIRCMTITQNVPPEVYNALTDDNIKAVEEYINKPMTASWFSEGKKGGKTSNEAVTAELIYYWMISLQIPPEYRKWHLNQLITLLRVCSSKNAPQKKMSRKATINQYAALNAARKKKLNTHG